MVSGAENPADMFTKPQTVATIVPLCVFIGEFPERRSRDVEAMVLASGGLSFADRAGRILTRSYLKGDPLDRQR